MAQIEVNKELCISSGFCVSDAPHFFEFDEGGLAQPRATVGSLPDELLREVAANCPVAAILITE